MKSILMSIQPQWVAKILNGEKTIEIRRKFPKDYVGWVYIYCTKGSKGLVTNMPNTKHLLVNKKMFPESKLLNEKVVCRFYCDKVEEIVLIGLRGGITKNSHFYPNCMPCFTKQMTEMDWKNATGGLDYTNCDNYFGEKNGYAIHISQLEIFDRPKELSEFNVYCEHKPNCWTARCRNCPHLWSNDDNYCVKQLTKSPQNYCYIEVEK